VSVCSLLFLFLHSLFVLERDTIINVAEVIIAMRKYGSILAISHHTHRKKPLSRGFLHFNFCVTFLCLKGDVMFIAAAKALSIFILMGIRDRYIPK
jgi:hypothetical protein